MRLAVAGDIHVRESDHGKWISYFEAVSKSADALLLCGDLTDTGKAHEAEILAEELKSCRVPVIAVLGNHDHDHDEQEKIHDILCENGVEMLDGDTAVVGNIGIAGVKGFGGGFDTKMLAMFGEKMMKKFVQETVDEVLKLDAALVKLETDHPNIHKVVMTHYAPIAETISGEPEQIYPFMGSSRLEQPINSRKVNAAFHGHAHIGILEGRSSQGVPVFNVSVPVLLKNNIKPPYFIYEAK